VSRFTAYLYLAAAFVIVGSSVVAGKTMTENLPVFLASTLRFAIAALVLLAVHARLLGLRVQLTRAEASTLAWQSLAGSFLFSVFLLYGLRATGAIEAGILMAMLPALAALAGWIFLGGRLTPQARDAAALAAGGMIALNLGEEGGESTFLGLVLVFAAVVCEAMFAVLGTRLRRLSPLTIATAMSVLGFLYFLPFGIYEGLSFDWSSAELADWLVVVYFALGVTVIAFALVTAGLARVEPRVAGAFTALVPLSAAVLAWIFRGEAVTAVHLLGGVLVLAGLVVITIGRGASA
jgi:drug/metabolite transporter (DMT)-like permease